MLILTAQIGEQIFVGDTPVKVCNIRGDKVQLGFDADRSAVPIEREKVRNRRLGITNTIPAASLPPEQHKRENPVAEAMKEIGEVIQILEDANPKKEVAK